MKSPEEIAFEICKQLTEHIHLIDGSMGLIAINHDTAEPLIAAAIQAERDAIKWPTEKEVLEAAGKLLVDNNNKTGINLCYFSTPFGFGHGVVWLKSYLSKEGGENGSK